MNSNSQSSPMGESSQIGRYGTMSLMKQDESNSVVTAFGIDSDNLTFGRDQNCGVRLYYPEVSSIHCKITFKERKAFLVVLGSQGLLVDGCRVFPSASPSSPNTIPLTNNSEVEIHGKRFRFTYPPKELRAQLLSTPTLPKRRALRLSMIESAEVFSPRPSTNAMENLRVLQSPLKPYSIRSRTSSPHIPTPPPRSLFPSKITSGTATEDKQDAAEEEEIILVEGDSPRVVEEAKDLVILEDVEVPPAVESTSPIPVVRRNQSKSPTKSRYIPAPPPLLLPPQTPMTPRRSRPTLHKAVLIRSAQRMVMAELHREEELEEQEEEAEVFGTVLGEDDQEDETENPQSENNNERVAVGKEDRKEGTSPTWKASLERIWPFRRSTSPTKTLTKDEESVSPLPEDLMDVDSENTATIDKTGNVDVTCENAEADVKDEDETEAIENPAPLYPRLDASLLAPPSRRLFNTPQPQRQTSVNPRFSLSPSSSALTNRSRMSLGGGEPRRIKVEEQPWKVQDLVVPSPPSSPTRPSHGLNANREHTPKVNQLSEVERRAIQERRRSALRTPDNFFSGGIPGMSPTKIIGPTPIRTGRLSHTANTDDQLDTRSLLEKMKETVEGMKAERRASLSSPQKRRFGDTKTDAEEFSLLRSPAKLPVRLSPTIFENEAEVLSTPVVAPPADPGSSTNHSDGDDVQMIDVSRDAFGGLPVVTISPLKTRTAPKKDVRENLVDTPSLADDEASPDVFGRKEDQESDNEPEQSSRKRSKVLRGIGKSHSVADNELSQKSSKPLLKTIMTTSSTSSSMKTVEIHDTELPVKAPSQDIGRETDGRNEQSEDAQSLKPQATTGRGRSRSRSKPPSAQAVVTPAEEISEKDSAATKTPLPLRRSTRKASAEPDTRTSEDEGPALTKRTRTAVGGRTRGEESDTDSSSKGVAKRPLARTTRARGKTPVSEAETDDTNDEEVAIAKTKRGRRPKAAIVPEVIKEEEVDELPTTKTTARSKKVVVSLDTSHPSVTSGTKGRSRKIAAPEPAVVTRTRIGRPRKAPTPKIKEEVTTEPETALRTGSRTRAMRTRSKT
ncbi:MAG: hypothetical protein NXY57DRAFT_1029754 [Lentinula lateritia]|nr:MAG: hypothetical protein NXY57DRAFT_1029754 [Lentinula lateritia]